MAERLVLAGVPVVLLTGIDRGQLASVAALRAAPVVAKPYGASELSKALSQALACPAWA